MISIVSHIETPLKAVERDTKISWYLRFLHFFAERVREGYKTKLDNFYILLLGSIELANSIPKEQAKKELEKIFKIQSVLIRLESILEKSDYLDDNDVKEKWNNCIDALYRLETEIRLQAYSGEKKNIDDKQLTYQITKKSMFNMNNVMTKYAN